ncbi:NAD(P)-dependent dehydrogenase (short-subunit alcohol dehydrogenase family) [Scopulibacillus darangshiensis]|uniref:NAD(P)-dependent dehydrogenase (Short-subunit alcohol dehydrogenase family) n=1 Tax=Scopulibacillus darangshiensis TaxID=442528 RepID=A0A4R2NEU8_9BACL|nr:SDR family oxidoreductase [Scopulibacillus darangshiensis]TCP19750.1 NAD(P)-dependent dehydrogenase (short-subunit alcohol dehydrogenase family) [Scopulibacillus darangshiensis]
MKEPEFKSQKPEHGYFEPDIQSNMVPQPESIDPNYKGSGKLEGKAAIVTGGDSGIGQAVAYAFAKEGADVSVIYYEAESDAKQTKTLIEKAGGRCLTIRGDVGNEAFCQKAIEQTVNMLGRLDILVNNAGEQHYCERIEEITSEQIDRTFRTNIFSMFYMTKAAMKYLYKGGSIINTASITAYQGNPVLMDYSATKGAIVSFTRAASQNKEFLAKGIRVNGVAPGPIWTPLIPATFPNEKLKKFGQDTPMKRPGQPRELAAAYVYLASNDSSYMSGQMLHVNGGTVVNG